MNTTSRTLVIVRHAKAEAIASSDDQRPLADRGRVDARALGEWLAGSGVRPDAALVSAALRTRQTWQELADGAGYTLDADHEPSLYAAGPDTALDLVRAVDEGIGTLLLLGHNPTMSFLAQMLDGGDGDPAAAADMTAGFPTAAVAVFDVPDAWSSLDMGNARLRAFHVARG